MGVSDRRRYGIAALLAAGTLVSAATLVIAQNSNPKERPAAERRQGPGRGLSHEGAFGTGGQPGPHPIGPSAITVTRTAYGGMRTQRSLVSGGQVIEASRSVPGGVMHAVRYGDGVNGVVERPTPRGYTVRTYVSGGRVVGARVFHVYHWQRRGRSIAYSRVMPAVVFAASYYAWAVRPWPTPVTYQWGWQDQPWYGAYGAYFTPYPTYTSLDLWMTDFILAQNMQVAYQANQPDSNQPSAEPPPPPTSVDPTATEFGVPPPMVTEDVKDELNAQIKVQIQEEQNAASIPASTNTPDAVKPGHVLFRVVSLLDVPTGSPNEFCSLNANDYVKRIGLDADDGTVPVKVRLSIPSDCPEGIVVHVALNDLMVMDGEQKAQALDALQAASKSMHSKELPQAPETTPILVAAGQATPDPAAVRTLNSM
jgi:hypothetical protein